MSDVKTNMTRSDTHIGAPNEVRERRTLHSQLLGQGMILVSDLLVCFQYFGVFGLALQFLTAIPATNINELVELGCGQETVSESQRE